MPSQRVDFKHVRAHASFEAVALHYEIELMGAGEQRSAHCTFHDDQRPSLKINLAKRIFHCFGCGKSGNILEFVTYMEDGDPASDRDLRSAALLLASISGIHAVPAGNGRAPQGALKKPATRARTERPEPVAEEAAKPEVKRNKPLSFVLRLDATHPYLAERSLSRETIEVFGLGVADRGLMTGRLAIPIHDEDGALIAYAGRWAARDVPKGVAKYLLPEGFGKNTVLFNLNRVPLGTAEVVMVESFFTVFRLHERGIPAVSPMGHDVSEEHCSLLAAHGIRNVTVLFDGDEAGAQGVAHSLPLLARHVFVKAPKVPAGFMPDECPEWTLQSLLET
ncbi:MAG: hypothetical protein K8F25_01485 [Fimbriimonadaceae bacterium]|nr:hypothetical protein [Alphaproteobacteria bacterium]